MCGVSHFELQITIGRLFGKYNFQLDKIRQNQRQNQLPPSGVNHSYRQPCEGLVTGLVWLMYWNQSWNVTTMLRI